MTTEEYKQFAMENGLAVWSTETKDETVWCTSGWKVDKVISWQPCIDTEARKK